MKSHLDLGFPHGNQHLLFWVFVTLWSGQCNII